MGVGVSGGVSPSPAFASSISTIFGLNTSFCTADIFWYACSTSLFFCSSNRPYSVSHRLDVFIDVEVCIPLVRSIVPHL